MNSKCVVRNGLFVTCLAMALTTNAQIDTTQALPDEQVEVIKAFDAKLADVVKLSGRPELPPLNTDPLRFEYNVRIAPLEIDYAPPVIRPIAMRAEAPKKSYDGSVKLGAGNRQGRFGMLDYRYAVERYYDIGLRLKHYSAEDSSIPNWKRVETAGDLQLGYYVNDQWKVDAAVGMHFDRHFSYAFPDLEPLDSLDRRRRNLVEASLSLNNRASDDADRRVGISLSGYRLNLKNEASDEVGFGGQIEGSGRLNDRLKIHATVGGHLVRYDFEDRGIDYEEFALRPTLLYTTRDLHVAVGVELQKVPGTFGVFPKLDAAIRIAGDKFVLTASAYGQYDVQSLRALTHLNPYVHNAIDSLFFAKTIGGSAGLKGRIGIFEYEGRAGYERVDDRPFFINDVDNPRRFQIVRDDIGRTYVAGSVRASIQPNLTVHGRIEQSIFDLNALSEPWHQPTLDVRAGAEWELIDRKLSVRADLFLADKTDVLLPDGTQKKLDALFDLNFGAHYAVHEYVGLFCQVNNVINNNYERWNGYERFGFNFLAGLTARF